MEGIRVGITASETQNEATSLFDDIMEAAKEGDLEQLKKLLQNSEDKNPKAKHEDGITPLHCAARFGHLSIVKFILPFISDKNPIAGEKWEGVTPLHQAAYNGHLHIVEYLEENNEAVINPGTGHDGLGLTVLHYAAQNGHLNIVSFYTKLIPDPNPGIRKKDTNLWGKTPLHYAAQLGHLPVIKHICNLLTDKNPKDSTGDTPLHLASFHGQIEAVKYLVQHVDDRHPKNGASYGQETPLDLAKQENQFEVVRFFQHLDEIERMKQRRAAKIIGKENKHVKTFTTKANGNDEEYDIDSVLQSLGIDDKKDQPKKKKPKKKVKKPQNEKVSKTEQLEKLESCGAEALPVELPPVKETAEECTICFEPRDQTYIFYPCGHATFCKNCALHLFEKPGKRCPDCRATIKDTFRVFQ